MKVVLYSTSYISMAAMVSYILLFSMAGLVMYAFYEGCAPMLTGKIKSADQVGCSFFCCLVACSFIHSFKDLYSTSSRKLLRGAPNSNTVKKNSF